MSTRLIVSAVVGVAVGYFAGPQAGFQAFSLTYGVTGSLDPNKKVQGPRLDDLKIASGSYGAPIAYIEGHPRVAGNIVWCTDKREIANEASQPGKGGPGIDTTTFTYECDLVIMLSENPGVLPRRCWSNGALIWSAADDASNETLTASQQTNSWRELRMYDGNSSQMPDPTYEAAVGVGNAPAYRDRSTIVIVGLNLGASGQFPVLTWEASAGATTTTSTTFLLDAPLLSDLHDITTPAATETISGTTPVSSGTETAFNSSTPSGSYVKYTEATMNLAVQASTDLFTCQAGIIFDTASGGGTCKFFTVGQEGGNLLTFNATLSGGVLSMSVLVEYSPGQLVASVGTPPGVHPDGSYPIYKMTAAANGDVKFYIDDALVASFTGWPRAAKDVWIGPRGFGSGGVVMEARNLECYLGDEPDSFTRITMTDPPLTEVVQRQWQRAGLDLAYLDVVGLAGKNVRAMAVSQVTSPRQIIDTLAAAYLFECVESGAIVRMVPRGGAPVATIAYDDLGATEGESIDPFPRTRGNELELPAQVNVKFANVDDDYQDGNESSTRLATGSDIVSTVEVPIGLTPTEAKRLAEISVTDGLASIIRFGPVGLTRKFASIEPTDVLLITGKTGSTYRVRVLKRTDSGGIANIEGVLDDATAINSNAITSGGYNSSSIVRAMGATDLELLDIPILRDSDDAPGIYAAAKPIEDPWSGYSLLVSPDSTTFSKIYDSTARAVIGTCTSTLGNFTGGNSVDESNSLNVDIGDGELSSVTLSSLINGSENAALIGSEIIQFATATLTSPGLYTLTRLLRGRRGTEWAIDEHVANERFVLLTASSLRRVTDQLSDIDVPRYWKGVTFGASATNTPFQGFTDTGVGLMPFAPVDLSIARDSGIGDATIEWDRRSRLSSRFMAEGIDPPLGESSEAYAVEIWNSTYTTLKRTISASSSSASYSAADQTTDFGSTQSTIYVRIYQISASIGRGYPLQASA